MTGRRSDKGWKGVVESETVDPGCGSRGRTPEVTSVGGDLGVVRQSGSRSRVNVPSVPTLSLRDSTPSSEETVDEKSLGSPERALGCSSGVPLLYRKVLL